MNGGLAHRLAMGAQPRVQFGAPRRGRRVHSLGHRFWWKFRLRCRHYPATRPRVVDPPFYRSGRRGIRVNPLSVESPRALSDKHACFGEWRKRGWGLLFLFLFSFSLFPIFLSGVGVKVSVLGPVGFFHLPSFFDIWLVTRETKGLAA